MRNIGEELKAKMTEKNSQALQAIIEACQHQFWKIDSKNKHLIEPSLHPLKLELEAYPQDDLESMFPNFKRYYISRESQPLTLDDILNSCQILCKHPQLQAQALECLNYLNQQSQLFPWMDEYSIEDGNILVKPKHNKELLEGVANLQNNELDDIVRMFYKHGATYAMKSSAVIKIFQDFVKPSNIKNIIKEYKGEGDFVQNFDDFVNKRLKHYNEIIEKGGSVEKATEHELQIFFDFGLSLVRFIATNTQK